MTEHPFPIKTEANQKADLGLDVVIDLVHRELGWEFRKTPLESDFGIDGYIDIVTPERYVTGKSLAVQVKSGASYFREKSENGWIFRGQIKHVNYYLNNPTKVLLVLVDENSKKAWWRLFEIYETSRTDSGWHIEIPSSNILTQSTKNKLEEIAGNHVNYLPHIEEFWALERKVSDHEILLIQVQRFEIESLNVRPFTRVFERLAATSDLRRLAMSKVDFLIDGYNEDDRELAEIPEVIQWLKLATNSVKYLLFFLRLDEESHGILQILAAHSKMIRVEGGMATEGPGEIFELIENLFGWLNEFTDKHGLQPFNRHLSEQFKERVYHFVGAPTKANAE